MHCDVASKVDVPRFCYCFSKFTSWSLLVAFEHGQNTCRVSNLEGYLECCHFFVYGRRRTIVFSDNILLIGSLWFMTLIFWFGRSLALCLGALTSLLCSVVVTLACLTSMQGGYRNEECVMKVCQCVKQNRSNAVFFETF